MSYSDGRSNRKEQFNDIASDMEMKNIQIQAPFGLEMILNAEELLFLTSHD